MVKPEQSLSSTFWKRILFYIIYFLAVIFILLLSAEITLRIRGIHPWYLQDPALKVEPGGRFYSTDSIVGYAPLPGTFKLTYANRYIYYRTHTSGGHRLTHPIETYSTKSAKPEIWVFGCSVTYGWIYLQDSATYPWMLQERIPDYEVVNFGVGGYSTLQSFLQFREALAKAKVKPKIVVIDYASFHDERNVCSRGWRKAILPFNKLGSVSLPRGWLDANGKLHYATEPVAYTAFPFMRHSALMHFLEMKYDEYQFNTLHAHDVSKAILLEFSDLCKTNHIPFVVAGITSEPQTLDVLQYCADRGILTTDISVDLSIKENTLYPVDNHPSAKANFQYAKKLFSFLTEKHLL
jgi:hypothetical protein